MVLLVAETGPLCAAIEAELGAAGVAYDVAAPDAESLWSAARDHAAIVYLSEARLLAAREAPRPAPARMEKVLRASSAPGVRRVVAVFPTGGAYEAEARVLRRHGKPYSIVEAAPLDAELAELVAPTPSTLLLPPVGQFELCHASDVARAVRDALTTELVGRVVVVEAHPVDAVGAARAAARAARAPVRVGRIWPWLYRVAAPLLGWWNRGQRRLLASLERALPTSEPRLLPASR